MKQYKAQAELAENEKSVLDKAGAIFEARGDYYARGFIEEAKGEALEAVTVADHEKSIHRLFNDRFPPL